MSTTMTSPEIDTLIKFLRTYGGSIISGHTKFAITPLILKQMNAIIENIKQDVYVSRLTNKDLIEKYANKNDIMFLYEFVRKTPKLKISNTISSHDFYVDVIDFGNLTYLELYKCNVKCIKNVHYLCENLEMIVCVRSLDNISDLLLCSQTNEELMWSKLRHAVFSRNTISKLDQSFIHTPWLQYLDLSYNHLTDLQQLACLQYLTYLNVSYNALTQVPTFPSKLKTLLLSNNYITDISKISILENLQECDLSQNCITEIADLFPLSNLPALRLLTISKNPVSYHPIYRSLTCGYLHENAANELFVLDGSPFTPAEREFIRRCSRTPSTLFVSTERRRTSSTSSYEESQPSKILPRKSIRCREPVIIDPLDTSYVSTDSLQKESMIHSTPIKNNAISKLENEEHLEIKKKLEELRARYGEDGWLHGVAASQVQNLLNLSEVETEVNVISGSVPAISEVFNSKASASITKAILDSSYKEESLISTTLPMLTENTIDANEIPAVEESTTNDGELTSSTQSTSVISVDIEESDDENDMEGPPLWPVTRIHSNTYQENVFLVLSDTELKEKSTVKNELIARWDINTIDRCVRVSSDPPTIELNFNVMQRNKSQRKYVMEYSDAETLIHRVSETIARKSLKEFNQKLLHCMKCDFFWCQEISKRKSMGYVEKKIIYICPTCNSKAVIEEEEKSVLPDASINDDCTPKSASSDAKKVQVTTSPSMSSIGSAASLEHSTETSNNGDSTVGNLESDIEIISNPSQSSIEVLEIHGSDNSKTVLKQANGVNSNSTSSVCPSANNQLLTESSSSGSMTDSICTSYETNNHLARGSHRISQSTVDEVLVEESSTETSPQQRQSEEKMTTGYVATSYENKKHDFSSVLGESVTDVIQSVSSKIIQASSPRKSPSTINISDYVPHQYSYTDFTYIDHRLKFHIWDEVVPPNEEISAFIRVSAIGKTGSSSAPFPGFIAFTNKKMYIIKITKENEEDIEELRIQKNDVVATEKIKLIQPILWKQGFLIDVEDRVNSNISCKYIAMLYDEKRTSNFVSFIRDLGTVHVLKSNDNSEKRDLKNLLDIDENVKNFTMSDSILIYKDDVKLNSFNFVGLIITHSRFILVKGDVDWLLPNSSAQPTKLCQELTCNLVNVEEAKNTVKLEFTDEYEVTEKRWFVKTVSAESNRRILNAIREVRKDLREDESMFS